MADYPGDEKSACFVEELASDFHGASMPGGSGQRSAVSSQRSAVSGQRSAVSSQQSAVSSQQLAVSDRAATGSYWGQSPENTSVAGPILKT
jgi:hypothetical protein